MAIGREDCEGGNRNTALAVLPFTNRSESRLSKEAWVFRYLNRVLFSVQLLKTICDMPFTLSHPLAVVPLRHTGLVFSALVVGSMSPDFEYFLRPLERVLPVGSDDHASHTLGGMFVICLPPGLLLLWLWHELLKRPLLELAPESHRIRLASCVGEFSFGPGRRFLLVCVSILLGAATHIIWDSFTHPWGWPVQKMALLQIKVPIPGIEPLALYRCLQHASTVLGFLAVLLVYLHWFRHASPAKGTVGAIPPIRRIQFVLAGGIVATVCGLVFAWYRFPLTDFENFRGFVVRTAVVAMAATAVQATFFALWFRSRGTQV